jgi:hypothetical protein
LPRRARLGDCRANRYETVGRLPKEDIIMVQPHSDAFLSGRRRHH